VKAVLESYFSPSLTTIVMLASLLADFCFAGINPRLVPSKVGGCIR
jgi:hypothetical protein